MASIEKFPRTKALDLARLEADVTAALPALPIRVAPTIHSEPLPDYVEHREGVSRVGALTAEAVVRDYEAAAKEIEAMGAELVSAAKKCEAMTADVHNAIAFMHDTAAACQKDLQAYRGVCAVHRVRKTCETVKRRMMEDGSILIGSSSATSFLVKRPPVWGCRAVARFNRIDQANRAAPASVNRTSPHSNGLTNMVSGLRARRRLRLVMRD